MISKRFAPATLALCLFCLPAAADDVSMQTDAEIQHLLDTTGESACSFIRNGKSHTAVEAESHLRLKYGNGKRWVSTTEQFIDRIASKSSWTGEKYYIDCPDSGRQLSGQWMSDQLAKYRLVSDTK